MTYNLAPLVIEGGTVIIKCHYSYPVAYFQGCATLINSWGPMHKNYVCHTTSYSTPCQVYQQIGVWLPS